MDIVFVVATDAFPFFFLCYRRNHGCCIWNYSYFSLLLLVVVLIKSLCIKILFCKEWREDNCFSCAVILAGPQQLLCSLSYHLVWLVLGIAQERVPQEGSKVDVKHPEAVRDQVKVDELCQGPEHPVDLEDSPSLRDRSWEKGKKFWMRVAILRLQLIDTIV